MSDQLELFYLEVEAVAASASKRASLEHAIEEHRWIKHPGRICTEETCPHYKYDSRPWGSCDEDSFSIIGGPMIGADCLATYYPGEGPRPPEPGVKERCQTCARFATCDWWRWTKPCLKYQEERPHA